VGKAFGDFGGTAAWFDVVPENPMTLYAAIGICVASFISGGTLTPDFTRFSKNSKIAVSTTLIAFFLGNSLMFFFGAVGSAFYQQSDISDVLVNQGMIVWAMIVLGLNIWTTNDNALYASGLGFSNITRLPKKIMVIVNGIIGTLLAIYLYNNFVGFLNVLNSMLPSIGGVLIADFFIVHKAKYIDFAERKIRNFRWSAVVAWGIGVLAATYLPGVAPVNSVVSSIVAYVIIEKAILKTETL
jgi:cytosine permease